MRDVVHDHDRYNVRPNKAHSRVCRTRESNRRTVINYIRM